MEGVGVGADAAEEDEALDAIADAAVEQAVGAFDVYVLQQSGTAVRLGQALARFDAA